MGIEYLQIHVQMGSNKVIKGTKGERYKAEM